MSSDQANPFELTGTEKTEVKTSCKLKHDSGKAGPFKRSMVVFQVAGHAKVHMNNYVGRIG